MWDASEAPPAPCDDGLLVVPESRRNLQEQLDSSSPTVDQLKQRILSLRHDLLNGFTTVSSCTDSHKSLGAAIEAASAARDQCQHARARLRAASELTSELKESWMELQRRRQLVLDLKETVIAVAELHAISRTLRESQSRGDYVEMTRICIRFEKLNASSPYPMDSMYACLGSVSGKVAEALAFAMRKLKEALRQACVCRGEGYVRCMRGFADLGATQHFPDHVLQVYENEGVRIYEETLALQARSSQKVISFFSMLGGLLQQFIRTVQFHRDSNGLREESDEVKHLRQSMAPLFDSREPPFACFAGLASRIVSALKCELLAEPTSHLLNVFQASNNFCSLTTVARGVTINGGERLWSLRTKKSITNGANEEKNHPTTLRRGASEEFAWRRSLRALKLSCNKRAWTQDFSAPITKAIRSLAVDFLNACHDHHADELKSLEEMSESWFRVKLTNADRITILQELFSSTGGRRQKIDSLNRNTLDDRSRDYVEYLSAKDATFTSLTLAVLRWVAEYVKIATAVPSVLSATLSSITDMFLSLLRSSIDLTGRLEILDSESFLNFMEDMLLERPKERSLTDFVAPALQTTLRVFLNRYQSQRSYAENQRKRDSQEQGGSLLTLLPYTFSRDFATRNVLSISSLHIARECVAAESIETLCDVLEPFSEHIAHEFRCSSSPNDPNMSPKLSSLRAALSLGRSIRAAFYELLAWDIVGGWAAIAAVAETCRAFHSHTSSQKHVPASVPSLYVSEMLGRIRSAYLHHLLPPSGAECLGKVICEAAMNVVLEGCSRVKACNHTAGASQLLVDLRILDLALVEHTGIHPCPGRERTEMFIKATFLKENEIMDWVEHHKRRLQLTEAHVNALMIGSREEEIPVIDQIITP